MRQILVIAAPLLLIAGTPALAQPAAQSHEQHQAAQNQQTAGEERCCCDEKMRQMMMQMMKDHQGMKMPPSGPGTENPEPPAHQHQH